MILADKIINLRKKCGYSQEELAFKMGVSRQAVSKWESAQSIPDLDKIIMLSKIFSVSTDLLLKDELEISDFNQVEESVEDDVKKVTMEMATDYINIKYKTSNYIAIGVLLCVWSPIILILLSGFTELYQFDEKLMVVIGLVSLFIFVAIAISLFLYSGYKVQMYQFLEKEVFETSYGVNGMVNEKKNKLRDAYFKNNLTGILLCLLSVIALFVGIFSKNNLYRILGLVFMLIIVGIGVFLIVRVGCKMGALERLLQEGDYSKEYKKSNPSINALSSIYWASTTAIYLLWSFLSNDWSKTWIVWVVASILYGGITCLIYELSKNKKIK